MREYELTYLVSDDVLEKDLKTITDRVAGVVSNAGGKVTEEEPWGRRKLTYPIQKQTFATYITLWLELPKEKIAEIEHELRVHPQIIRHLIVAKIAKDDPSREGEAEAQSLTVTKEDVVGAEDVEKIIGEKSFEVVEGETEGSRNLMAKRENADAKTTETLTNASTTQKETQIDTDKTKEKKEIEKLASAEATADKTKKNTVKKVEKEVKKPVVAEEIMEKEPVKIEETPEPEPKVDKLVEKPSSAKATDGEATEDKDDEASTTQTTNTENDTERSDATEESERIKKLDEKLDELLKDDL